MELTIKEYAHAERVTTRTVRNWARKGAIQVRRTPGGGVRVILPESERRVVFIGIERTTESVAQS